jgi:hypothetical protein
MTEANQHREAAEPAVYDEESRHGRAVLVRHQRAPLLVAVVDGAERLLAADLLSQAAPGSLV